VGRKIPPGGHLKISGLTTNNNTKAQGVVWAIYFQFHSTMAGKPFKVLYTVDDDTGQALGGRVDYSITAEELIYELEILITPTRYAQNTPRGKRTAIHFESPSWMGYLGGFSVYLTKTTIAKRVYQTLQRQTQGRMSQCPPSFTF
jgi:hypothetical protein